MESRGGTAKQRPLLRKSRSGCRDCRLRRVKCCETRPICSNCRRRYVNLQCCDWGPDVSRNVADNGPTREAPVSQTSRSKGFRRMFASTQNARTYTLSLHPSSSRSTGRWRNLELRLMHHYATVVSHTMPDCHYAPTETWQRTIPQLAFDSELLLSPLLALTALHLHAHSKTDSNMAVALRLYVDKALVSHRQALLEANEQQVEQLWLSGVMLAHVYWLLAHEAQPNEAYRLPLSAIDMLEGLGVLYNQNCVSLGRKGYRWAESETLQCQICTESDEKISSAAQMQLQNIEEDLKRLFEAFEVPTLPDKEKAIYEAVREYVVSHWCTYFTLSDSQDFMRFIGYISKKSHPDYRRKLKQHDLLSMALMARIMCVYHETDDPWWMYGKGDYEVVKRDIQGIRSLVPEKLRWVMDWPCEAIKEEVILAGYG